MMAPILIFVLVFVVMAWQLIRGTSAAGSPTIPIWMVVLGSLSLLASMVGGVLFLAYRNRRSPPKDSQDRQG